MTQQTVLKAHNPGKKLKRGPGVTKESAEIVARRNIMKKIVG